MLNVVLASDENYFPGLAGALLSVAYNTNEKVTIYVIDGGILDQSWLKLLNHVNQKLKHISLQRIKPDLTKLYKIKKKDNGGGVNAYVRVLVGSLFPDLDRIVYIDSDFYFGKNIAELSAIDFEGNVAMVVQDVGEVYLKNDCPVLEEYNLPPLAPYFNSGFMVIDLNAWRREQIEDKTLDVLYKYSDKCRCYDQTALNVTLHGHVKFIDLEWNDHKYYQVNFEHKDLNVNFHMFGPHKPWNGYPVSSYYYAYQLMLDKAGFGNLNAKRFLLKDYYKILFFGGMYQLGIYPENHFWTKLFQSRKNVKRLFDDRINLFSNKINA